LVDMADPSTKIPRIVCAQWQMLPMPNVADCLVRVEALVVEAAGLGGDLLLLPELFNLPLLSLWREATAVQAMQELAAFSAEIVAACCAWAVRYRINILAGSLPQVESGLLYNVATFCHRDGRAPHCQYKLHATPYEKREWAMQGGDTLATFDSDCGRVGILICYDVEFPELARLLALQQMQILLVPFWTDTPSAYLRVRYCAQARAIENECYVVLAGSVGEMNDTDVTDVQYAQSAVFSPSDIPFPERAIVAEAESHRAMLLLADLDLAKLDVLRREGAVQNRKDQRGDLYQINWRGKN
jgi:predicted amidohydrolase